MKGVGAAGVAGIVGGGSTVAASEHESDHGNGDSGSEFAAVRVGNLVPDLAAGSSGDSDPPGRGPPMDTPGRSTRRLRSTALDLYVGKPPDGNPTIGNVHYRSFGPGAGDAYLQVPEYDEYEVAVARSGTTEPLLEETVAVEGANRYTALAVGSLYPEDDEEEFQSLIIQDGGDRDDITPPENRAEASFVHASPNAGQVDVLVDGATVLEDAEFGDVSDYVAVPQGDYDVEVQSDGDTVLSLTRELIAGTRVTFYVTGLAGVDEFPDEDGRYGLAGVASVDGLNPLPTEVLTR